MSDERHLTNEERKLEASLSRLKPREPLMNAAMIAYEAGRSACAWRLTAWRSIAAVLLVAIILTGLLRSPPRTIEKIVFVPAQTPAITAISRTSYAPSQQDSQPRTGTFTYINLRQDVIEHGWDALPASPPSAPTDATVPHLGSSRSLSGDNL